MMVAFKVILLLGLVIAALGAFGSKEVKERLEARWLVVIFGALYVAAEIVTRILP